MVQKKKLIRSIVVVMGVMLTFAVTTAFTATEDLVGAVVKTDQGAALSTEDGEYLFLGRNLYGMIGKTVLVTGNVENGVLASTVRVKSVKVLSSTDLIDSWAHKAGPATSPSAA